MSIKYNVVLLTCVILLAPIVCEAFSDWAEIANLAQDTTTAIQTAEQLNEAIQTLHNAVVNTKTVSNYQYNSATNLLQRVDQNMQQGQAISYSMSNIDQQFRSTYPNYTSSPYGQMNYSDQYHRWNNGTLDTLRNTLSSIGMTAQDLSSEESLVQSLHRQGQTATGRMQVLQVSTEIASENLNQMQELKRLVMQQSNAQTAYMSYQVSKDSYDEQSLKALSDHASTTYPTYHNNPNLGMIPNF